MSDYGRTDEAMVLCYAQAFQKWRAGVKRRARAVAEGKLSARVAAKRDAEARAHAEAWLDGPRYPSIYAWRVRVWLESLTFRKARYPCTRAVRSVAYLSLVLLLLAVACTPEQRANLRPVHCVDTEMLREDRGLFVAFDRRQFFCSANAFLASRLTRGSGRPLPRVDR